MNHRNLTTEQEIQVETHTPYLRIFWIVLGLTVVEYTYATFVPVRFAALVVGLMALAGVKVLLVGWYFMHLKFANRWIHWLLVPTGILSLVLVAALVPDMVFPPR